MSTRFYNPTEIRWSCWQSVGQLLPAPPLRVLVIAGRSSQSRVERLCDQLLPGYDVRILSNVPVDPTANSVQEAIDSVKAERPDWIIAIGGGSVLDTAKAAALLANSRGDVLAYLRGELEVEVPSLPVIAVPTTAGSGSEVTPYASITDSQNMRKISLTHDYLYPKYALLDPELTLTLTRRQTAISGMDALSHAIEGYWSKGSSTVTDSFALAAARLILASLPTAYRDAADIEARRLTMEGSMLAGLTISNAKTTAVHAVSYPLTVFFHVPHGLACAMLLPSMVRYNDGAMAPEKEHQLLHSLGMTSMNHLAELIEDIQEQLDLPVRLRDLGLRRADITTIVDNGFRPDRVGNNPRPITALDLRSLLEDIN